MPQVIIAAGLCVLGLILTVEASHYGDIQFMAAPNPLKQGLTRQVGMRCESVEVTNGKEVELITQIIVTQDSNFDDGSYVAVVTTNEPASSYIDEGNLRVEGNVTGMMGYLQLTWDQPFQMSMGTYKCVIHGKSKSNKSVMLSKALWLATKKPTMDDLVQRINDNERDRQERDKKHEEDIKNGCGCTSGK